MDKKAVYEQVLELRNRLSNEGSGQVFEEDHITLDYALDLLEVLIDIEKVMNKEY